MHVWTDEQLIMSRTQDEFIEVEECLSAISRELGLNLPEHFLDVRQFLPLPRRVNRGYTGHEDIVKEFVASELCAMLRILLAEDSNSLVVRVFGAKLRSQRGDPVAGTKMVSVPRSSRFDWQRAG
jgi:hypothetical protein